MKRALITGSLGQDGRLLTSYLIGLGYQVIGVNRTTSSQDSLIQNQKNYLHHNLNFLDSKKFHELIDLYNPMEIYNLAGISNVAKSFQIPEETIAVNGQAVVNTLDYLQSKSRHRQIRYFQASSSEMFGKTNSVPQREDTNFHPTSPYGISKVLAHQACQNYRETYGMFISTGIMYNHESELRPIDFVTRKITYNVARIANKKISSFSLGSLDAIRDWGYAGDYVRAMHLILNYEVPEDFILATGESHSVRDFLVKALQYAQLDGEIENYVKYDKKEIRPNEPKLLVGDSSKAMIKLGWNRNLNFEQLIERMVSHDLALTSEADLY